ncbi:hypothetical protein C8F01DRAFT_1252568 [Mycena amicta]|nr:hypothetical protein C8F01DRAFT_1252568 [Mycena amicta]
MREDALFTAPNGLTLHMFNSQFFAIASLALLIGSSTVSAQLDIFCNDSGASGNCAPFITTFCSSVGSFPINASDTAARCFTTSTPNLRCDFAAENTGAATSDFSIENCETGLTAVVDACPPQGGSTEFVGAAFKFFIDPNTGACAPQCGN